jgi:hypothetical protein
MSQWQDISTAPLNPPGKANGPWVLVFCKFDHGVYQARWVASGDGGEWKTLAKQVDYPRMTQQYITHWMPLPPEPAGAA